MNAREILELRKKQLEAQKVRRDSLAPTAAESYAHSIGEIPDVVHETPAPEEVEAMSPVQAEPMPEATPKRRRKKVDTSVPSPEGEPVDSETTEDFDPIEGEGGEM